MAIPLQNGDLVSAGFDRPWYASKGAVEGALKGMGITGVVWHSGTVGAPAGAVTTNEGSWDEWVSAVYNGPPTSFDPPSQVKWVYRMASTTAPVVVVPAGGETPIVQVFAENVVNNTTPTQILGAIMLDVGLGMLLVRLLKNRKNQSS